MITLKRISKKLVLSLTIAIMLASCTLAYAASSSFTHPEIGEYMTVHVSYGGAQFDIYGFPYYVVPSPTRSHRGIKVNKSELINKDNPPFDTAITKLFDSLNGRYKNFPVPKSFRLGGTAEPYTEYIMALPVEQRLEALKALGGFNGLEGYDALLGYPGFTADDVAKFKQEHREYRVKIRNNIYPYRVLQFYFEEDDAYGYFNERYAFVETKGRSWVLLRIAKEYDIAYAQRSKYIHGLSGSNAEDLLDANSEALYGMSPGMSFEEVLAQTNGVVGKKNTITLNDTELYRMPCSLTFHFDDENRLYKTTYKFTQRQSYYSAFVSLYIRYYDPLVINANKKTAWNLDNMLIELNGDSKTPTLSFEIY